MRSTVASSVVAVVVIVALTCTRTTAAQAPTAWLNEFHYDDAGADSAEFIEIIVDNSFADLERFAVVLYNGAESQLKVYATHKLSTFNAGPQQHNFTVYSKLVSGLQNGPDGFALCFDSNDDADFEELIQSGTTAQFLSYEGSFTPVDGCAAGVAATDIGIEETTTAPEGSSLGLVGTGTSYDDFTWTVFDSSTVGAVNAGQTLSALAVHLAVFHAVVDGYSTVLRWSTRSEERHAGFNVERRTAGRFVDAGFVPAAGVNGLGADYVFVDTESGSNSDGYRLRMTGRDGSVDYSPVIRPAHQREGQPALSAAFPNPVFGHSSFTWTPRRSGPARITLHDLLGREVAVIFDGSAAVGSVLTLGIDATDLASGPYFYHLQSNGEYEARRIIIAR
jgi:hypothetical protein